jgi:hypothetical protein
MDRRVQAKLYDVKVLPVIKIQAREPGFTEQFVQ